MLLAGNHCLPDYNFERFLILPFHPDWWSPAAEADASHGRRGLWKGPQTKLHVCNETVFILLLRFCAVPANSGIWIPHWCRERRDLSVKSTETQQHQRRNLTGSKLKGKFLAGIARRGEEGDISLFNTLWFLHWCKLLPFLFSIILQSLCNWCEWLLATDSYNSRLSMRRLLRVCRQVTKDSLHFLLSGGEENKDKDPWAEKKKCHCMLSIALWGQKWKWVSVSVRLIISN